MGIQGGVTQKDFSNNEIPMMSDEEINSQPVKSSGLDSLSAQFTNTKTGIDYVGNIIAHKIMDPEIQKNAEDMGSSNMSVEDLNKKYPNLPQPFVSPTNPFVAGDIAQKQYERQHIQEIADGGPTSGLYSAASVGVGLLAHALDPLEMGAAVLTGGATEAALGLTVAGKGLGFGVEKGAQTLLQKFATGVAEGTVANIATSPAEYYSKGQDNLPFSVSETMANAAMGGLAFGVLKAGGSALSRWLFKQPPENIRAAFNTTKTLLERDKLPDISPIVNQMIGEQSGKIASDYIPKSNYEFKPLDSSKLKETKFYEALDGVHFGYADGKSLPLGDGNEAGRHFTDNPAVANGVSRGSVNTVSLGDLKLENINEVSSPKFRDALGASLEGHGIEMPAIPELKSGKELMNNIAQSLVDRENGPQVFDQIQKRLAFEAKIRDIEGFHETVNSTGGTPHDPYNRVQVFDPNHESIDVTDNAPRNEKAVYKPDPEDIKNLGLKNQSPESDIFHDQKAQENFDSIAKNPPADMKLEEYKKLGDDMTKELQDQHNAYPDEDIQKMLDDVKANDEESNSLQKFYKAAMHCLTGGE